MERSNFSVPTKELYLADHSNKVSVLVPQEKGADVNLATSMLLDAYHDRYDLAMVLSNDSDLENPVKAVRLDFEKMVRVFAPIKSGHQRISDKLVRAAGQNNHEIIPFELVMECQLPNPVTRSRGKDLIKPREWS